MKRVGKGYSASARAPRERRQNASDSGTRRQAEQVGDERIDVDRLDRRERDALLLTVGPPRLDPMGRGEKNVLFVLVLMLILWILPRSS